MGLWRRVQAQSQAGNAYACKAARKSQITGSLDDSRESFRQLRDNWNVGLGPLARTASSWAM